MRPYAGELGRSYSEGQAGRYGKRKTAAYGLNLLQPRGELFVGPGVDVYEGMVVGENARMATWMSTLQR